MGWSLGGDCAAERHLGQPARFGAAASIEGYFKPEPDTNTGNLGQLLNQHPDLAHQSSPTWLIENTPPPRVHPLVMSSDTDPQSYPQALEFLRRERNVPGIQPYLVKGLAHNWSDYSPSWCQYWTGWQPWLTPEPTDSRHIRHQTPPDTCCRLTGASDSSS